MCSCDENLQDGHSHRSYFSTFWYAQGGGKDRCSEEHAATADFIGMLSVDQLSAHGNERSHFCSRIAKKVGVWRC